jgi:mono/diheme cytochrome c family protein
MLSAAMARRRTGSPLALVAAAAALASAGCGTEKISLAKDDPNYQGAVLFDQRCSGCHTLDVAGAQGSAVDIATREYKDGPNFNERVESVDDVLYAIRNGGFSSGPMPQNIAVGEEARQLAEFVAKYAGRQAERPLDPTGGNPPTPPGAEQPEDAQ